MKPFDRQAMVDLLLGLELRIEALRAPDPVRPEVRRRALARNRTLRRRILRALRRST